MLSIVIPAFNESENVRLIAKQIKQVLKNINYEIIFVDDSSDDTPQVLEKLVLEDSSVRFEHREKERGLATAVVRGFQLATGDMITVMDADLQHPPEMLPQMIEVIESGYDVVIPSRFVPGGNDGGLSPFRKLVSWTARWAGKLALTSIRKISDPTSGFFMFKKKIIEGVTLRPIGWKILIEVLVRGNYQSVVEIPYEFHAREAGESKMSIQEQWNYIRHLQRLLIESPRDRRFYLFTLVGLSGVVVNMLIYNTLVKLTIPVVYAGILSALCAMVSNFILNDIVTWSDVHYGEFHVRVFKNFFTSTGGIIINALVLALLYHGLHVHYLLANFLGIAIATIWNYLLNSVWTWKNEDNAVSVINSTSLLKKQQP